MTPSLGRTGAGAVADPLAAGTPDTGVGVPGTGRVCGGKPDWGTNWGGCVGVANPGGGRGDVPGGGGNGKGGRNPGGLQCQLLLGSTSSIFQVGRTVGSPWVGRQEAM